MDTIGETSGNYTDHYVPPAPPNENNPLLMLSPSVTEDRCSPMWTDVSELLHVAFLLSLIPTLKMEEIFRSETSVHIRITRYPRRWQHSELPLREPQTAIAYGNITNRSSERTECWGDLYKVKKTESYVESTVMCQSVHTQPEVRSELKTKKN
jgi:hypothetical protein